MDETPIGSDSTVWWDVRMGLLREISPVDEFIFLKMVDYNNK